MTQTKEIAKEYRRCQVCTTFLTEGFVVDGGDSYFCNDHEPSWFKEAYEADPDGDTYWTEWE